MRNFIKALPFDLIESARIEGIGEFKIFWYVVLPLVRPAIAALSVLIFTFVWNDFFWANGADARRGRLSRLLRASARLNGQFVSQWHLVSAGVADGGSSAGGDVFPDAKALHCWSDIRGR